MYVYTIYIALDSRELAGKVISYSQERWGKCFINNSTSHYNKMNDKFNNKVLIVVYFFCHCIIRLFV